METLRRTDLKVKVQKYKFGIIPWGRPTVLEPGDSTTRTLLQIRKEHNTETGRDQVELRQTEFEVDFREGQKAVVTRNRGTSSAEVRHMFPVYHKRKRVPMGGTTYLSLTTVRPQR